MNKKHLSVVMAGAMLASSVAPVLAEVVKEEVSANELGLLQEEVRTLVESARFANESANVQTIEGKTVDVRNQSVYAVYINNKKVDLDADSKTQEWQKVFNSLRVGDVVKVFDKGHVEKDGKNYHYEIQSGVKTYTKAELEDLNRVLTNNNLVGENKVIHKVEYDKTLQAAVIEFNNDVDIPGLESNNGSSKTMTLTTNDKKIKLTAAGVVEYYRADGTIGYAVSDVPTPEEFNGFVFDDTIVTNAKPIAASLVKEYTITPGGYNYNVSDLYDGLFLTEKGNDFFGMLKDSVAADRYANLYVGENNFYGIGSLKSEDQELVKQAEKNIFAALKEYKGVYRFEVKLSAKDDLKEETYVISGKDKKEVARLASWMLTPQARVDVLSGSNRYETAVEIAKEYAGLRGPKATANNKTIEDIVLVNGNALVDGLAAAPLASKLENGKHKVPMLLTESDHLPKATVKFLKELMADHLVGNNKSATIHLVGGEAVLSKNLERELRALNFKIERHGGANREETSLEVMKAMGVDAQTANKKVFVVGANGEADAMSIAAVAADQKTPIVVTANNGISEDAVYELKGMDATIIGGKAVVTAEDEKALREEAKSVNRIFGANRKATNAEVIEKYYNKAGFADGVGRAQNIIVAKDGQNNKMELVDALAAANMAAAKKAPIVLATDKLSKEQEAKINSYATDAYGLFQVGGGVSRDVVKTIARMLNLTNR